MNNRPATASKRPRPIRTGDALGTPGYASPEQVRGLAVDARADLFAVGAVLYEVIRGVRPFDAATRSGVERAVLERDPDLRGLPRDLAAVLETAPAKDPAQRYAAAADFADDLPRIREHRPVAVRRSGPLRRGLRARSAPRASSA